jgi:tetratricopeptide (TPR) repeat protein
VACQLIPEISQGLDLFEEKINKEKQLLFTYNMAYSHFGVGEYRTALKYINEVLNDNEKQLRQDIYSFSRIFNLIIHFELKNMDFLEYDLKSAARYLNKYPKDYQVEKLFITHIKMLSREEDLEAQKAIFVRFNEKLTQLLQDDKENVILEYFDLLAWTNSKIEKISFSEAIKNRISPLVVH